MHHVRRIVLLVGINENKVERVLQLRDSAQGIAHVNVNFVPVGR